MVDLAAASDLRDPVVGLERGALEQQSRDVERSRADDECCPDGGKLLGNRQAAAEVVGQGGVGD